MSRFGRKNSEMLGTRLTREQATAVRAFASRKGLTVGEYLRACVLALNENDPEAAEVLLEDLLAAMGTSRDDPKAALEAIKSLLEKTGGEGEGGGAKQPDRRASRSSRSARPTKRLNAAGEDPLTEAEEKAAEGMTPEQRADFTRRRAEHKKYKAARKADRARDRQRARNHERKAGIKNPLGHVSK